MTVLVDIDDRALWVEMAKTRCPVWVWSDVRQAWRLARLVYWPLTRRPSRPRVEFTGGGAASVRRTWIVPFDGSNPPTHNPQEVTA